MENNAYSEAQVSALASFLEKNKNVEFVSVDLSDASTLASLNWQQAKQEDILAVLLAYQRLKKIAPTLNPDTALALLRAGIHSALQIAALPKVRFIQGFGALFGDAAPTIEQFYNQALAIRSQILLQYMEVKQSSEPHVSAARVQ